MSLPNQPKNSLPFSQNLAFVVGIDRYQNLSNLQTALNDARAFAEVLAEQHHFQIASLRENPALTDLQTLMIQMKEMIKAEDRVVIYFAGHGIAADGENGPSGYLVPSDANPDAVETFLPMDTFNQTLQELPCRHLLLILDCCFSGAFEWSTRHRAIGKLMPRRIYKERFDRFVQDPAWQVLSSAAYDQKALDVLKNTAIGERGLSAGSAEKTRHSPFAAALIEGLHGAADAKAGAEGDGVITATELYLYTRDQVETASINDNEKRRQTPGFFPLEKHDKGEFVFLHPQHRLNLPPIPKRNPYMGLNSFDEEDQELFYGRGPGN